MKQSLLVRIVGLLAVVVAAVGPLAGAAQPVPPNVVLVLTDDQGYGDLSCHGNPVLKTPHMDRLRAESLRLTDFHVAPMCTPTRAQLMTGRDALASGAMNVSSGRALLRRELPTMADVFRSSGYCTAIFGKWHLGDAYPYRPEDRGFDEAVWFPSSHIGSAPDAWDNDYFDDVYVHNGRRQQYRGYCTDVFFGQAMNWMRQCRAAGSPFFVYLPLNAAHAPHFVPEEYCRPYTDQKQPVPKFFGMIANIDENLGRLEAMLRETGLRENTLLVFMTDNGGTAGVPLYNAGMRGGKVTLWDGGHRVPCFLRWPQGGLGQPRDLPQLTECQDLLPTFVDLCGLKTPAGAVFDGVSLAGLLRGAADGFPDRTLVVQFSRMNAPRPSCGDAAVLWRRWRLVSDRELYDLTQDPGQRHNLFEQNPEIVARLRAHYGQWWSRVEPGLDRFQPVHVGAAQENPTLLSACEWADVFLDQSRQVRRGEHKNGVWHVLVEREGDYELALCRWPREAGAGLRQSLPPHQGELGEYEAGVAMPIAKARLRIGPEDRSLPVGEQDREALFRVHLPQGRTILQTWFYDDQGQELCGAYYVYVNRK